MGRLSSSPLLLLSSSSAGVRNGSTRARSLDDDDDDDDDLSATLSEDQRKESTAAVIISNEEEILPVSSGFKSFRTADSTSLFRRRFLAFGRGATPPLPDEKLDIGLPGWMLVLFFNKLGNFELCREDPTCTIQYHSIGATR